MLSSQANDQVLLFSRRRPRASQRHGERLPDWVWGLGLGVLLLAVVGGFLLISGGLPGGGGGSTCDEPLKPLNTSDISAQGFADEDAALGRVADFLNNGDLSAAEAAFYGTVHNFTHNADPPIREKDEALAKDLCKAVIDLEESLPGGVSTLQLSIKTQRVRDLLADGAVALGYPRS